MKLVKMAPLVAGLGLLVGCSTNGQSEELPSDVAAVISENCGDCHSDPPANNAPIPIQNCDDVLAAAPISDGTVLEAMEARINADDDTVMPPTGQMASDPLTTVNDWIAEGAPPCE